MGAFLGALQGAKRRRNPDLRRSSRAGGRGGCCWWRSKSEVGGARAAVLAGIATLAAAYAGPLALMSFDPAVMAALKELAPGVLEASSRAPTETRRYRLVSGQNCRVPRLRPVATAGQRPGRATDFLPITSSLALAGHAVCARGRGTASLFTWTGAQRGGPPYRRSVGRTPSIFEGYEALGLGLFGSTFCKLPRPKRATQCSSSCIYAPSRVACQDRLR